MEPLFFKAENTAPPELWLEIDGMLQWSRFFSKRKILLTRSLQCNKELCFNGAAFFQSGKC